MRRRLDPGSERGAALVMVVFALPVLLLFASFAIDLPNFFVHKRHLQTQADAAALAGASQLQTFNCNATAVDAMTRKYSGVAAGDYNRQVGGADNPVTLTYNQELCTGSPYAVDVTMRETGVPWLIKMAGLGPADIAARARVELKTLAGGVSGMTPAALEDERITGVQAIFVDESKPASDASRVLATKALHVVAEDATGASWGNDGDPVEIANVTQSSIGVRFAVSYGSSTTCGDATVDCLDLGSDKGLLHIHGFEQPASAVTAAAPPALEGVKLLPIGCASGNGYANSGGCTIRVQATVDWVDGLNLSAAAKQAFIHAHLGGQNVDLAHVSGKLWQGDLTLPLDAGPANLTLDWEQRAQKISSATTCGTGKNVCTGVFRGEQAAGVPTTDLSTATPVHRTFALTDSRSGSATFAEVLEAGTVTNSVKRCTGTDTSCAHSFTVHIGLPGELRLGGKLVFSTDQSESNDYLLSCLGGGAADLQTTMATGCSQMMSVNQGEACPDWSAYPAVPEPWTCVPSHPGAPANSPSNGLTERVYGTANPTAAECSAHPNRWPTQDWTPDDPRIMHVVLVRRGQLSTNGRKVFPIKGFATIYLTGWSGANDNDPCKGVGGNEISPVKTFTGYFITYVHPNDGDVEGGEPCTGTELLACVPIMTE